MNENFEELAELCYTRYKEHNIDLEMFAKLIVLKCIDLVEGFSYLEEMAEDQYEEIYAEQVLIEYFGIE